ncbi:MAG TPA: (2Fe-2S)-binding protein [Thermoanaerobaculia bacterium]|jgi:NAD(P)H-nitrite reductase large subunit|nr:(2Fe-2S)-binding protein [Thermoanaerobaculia bacterium]
MDDSPSLHPAIRGLKTVCRCNNIKYRTLERAIRDDAQTIDEIAKRTGATTGHCGGTCTPDVLAMIAEIAGTVTCAAQQQPCASSADAWWVRKQ